MHKDISADKEKTLVEKDKKSEWSKKYEKETTEFLPSLAWKQKIKKKQIQHS